MSSTFPDGGIAQQGISAAIVYQAINKITEMLETADQQMADHIQPSINKPLSEISGQPDMLQASYNESLKAARDALSDAGLEGENPAVPTLPAILDQTLSSFFEGYTGVLEQLFPGLGAAGADADAFVRNALASATGVSYSELVDSTPGETAFLLARKEGFVQERAALDAAAAAGHRFAPGATLDAIARMHAETLRPSAEALAATMQARLAQERGDKLRMVAAELSTDLARIRKLHAQAADAFKQKLQARGMWVADQDAVLDADGQRYTMNAQFKARVAELLRAVAGRRHGTIVAGLQAGDRSLEVGRLKVANGQEVVDLFGNMVTTLLNQVRASGAYQGQERDVSDWESILG